jgi:DNA replication protein DnaC
VANIQSLPLLLKELRLSEINKQWYALAEKAIKDDWEPAQYLVELCELETNTRYENKLKRLLKDSQLPTGKQLSQYDFSEVNGITSQQLQKKTTELDWLRKGHNVLLFGASGLGKTHLGAAIGHALIAKSIRVKFASATALVQLLQRARDELGLEAALKKLDKYELLILDDIGYVKKSDSESQVLFELIAHRYERCSLLITTNQSFSEWDSIFGDTMMTVAAIDRLVHHADIYTLQGESYRKKHALKSKIQNRPS